jgi:DNA-directed RNA polymerase specialized sigma24 family protein
MPLLANTRRSGRAANGQPAMLSPLSTIADDRIARLRRRIADGSYAVDRRLLAETLAAQEDGLCAVASKPVRAAAVAMLQTALATLDHGSVMVLQLHFVEQLRPAETAQIMDYGEAEARDLRRHLLCRLHAIISLD